VKRRKELGRKCERAHLQGRFANRPYGRISVEPFARF